jgi:hypothetical protein
LRAEQSVRPIYRSALYAGITIDTRLLVLPSEFIAHPCSFLIY